MHRDRFLWLSTVVGACLSACASQPKAAATAAPGSKSSAATVVWDGDTVGFRARGWASCNTKPDCVTSVGVRKGVGADGGSAILFHGDGAGWLGFGWNWVGYGTRTATFSSLRGRPAPFELGTDIANYDNVQFRLRLVAASDTDVGSLSVGIGSAAARKHSRMVPLQHYASQPLNDGQWHALSIPLANLRDGAALAFDPHSAWEFDFSSNAATARSFDLYVDDIAFNTRAH